MKQIAQFTSSSAWESSHFQLPVKKNRSGGFTIVELLIVIVVIAILATVTVVAYNGISQKARVATLQGDLSHAGKALAMANAENSAYPSNASDCPSPVPGSGNICLRSSPGTSYQYTYTSADNSYCLTATNGNTPYMISSANSVSRPGVCPGHTAPAGATANSWDQIATNNNTSCAISTGRAYCWGGNGYGQLGNGTATSSSVPIAVSTAGVLAGKTVASISIGYDVTCAVASGRAYCWGSNTYGQLGDGTYTDSFVPIAVSTAGVLAGKTVTSISAGNYSTCAIASGQAYCWGLGNYGQLGNGSTSSALPIAVSTAGVLAGKTVTTISIGDYSACAVASGQAYCWGDNTYGRLGDGTTTGSNTPIAVSTAGVLAGKTVTSISAGINAACALANGQAYCWGLNASGQFGDGTYTDSSVPVATSIAGVLSGKTVTTISAGVDTTCAVASGQAYCWGSNYRGRLGDGTTTGSNTPIAVSTAGVLAGKTVTDIDMHGTHSCALASGQAYCWGSNYMGKLGNGTTTGSYVPVTVLQP